MEHKPVPTPEYEEEDYGEDYKDLPLVKVSTKEQLDIEDCSTMENEPTYNKALEWGLHK